MKTLRYLVSEAEVSACGVYRYSLTRRLSMGDRVILFVGLNPSTADAVRDDPTIRREIGYARRWGFDWYLKGNLYAYRSTDPRVLEDVDDAVGPRNVAAMLELMARAEMVLCAWGRHPLTSTAKALANTVSRDPRSRYLSLNKDGSPGHTLYLKASLSPQPFALAHATAIGGSPG